LDTKRFTRHFEARYHVTLTKKIFPKSRHFRKSFNFFYSPQ